LLDELTVGGSEVGHRQAPISSDRQLRGLALRPLFVLAALTALLLLAFAHGYGYHRDELYFIVAGNHLAWSYPDQGPLTPLLAHLMSGLAPSSLTVLRAPSALMAAGTVFLGGLLSYEFGGSRRAQFIAASCTAAAPIVLSLGHLLSTSTYDLFAWSLLIWLVVRAIRLHSPALWLLGGLVAGTALLNKPLIAFLLLAMFIGIGLAGPREQLRQPWPWIAALVALAIWSPWLVWQAQHGWPQLHISSSIASGGSASSQPRWALLPFQFLLAGPPLAPVWVAGLVGLARGGDLRRHRWLAVVWLVLLVFFEIAGGKPYYLCGLLPALFAAGAIVIDGWLMDGGNARRYLLTGAVALSALVSALLALPILPASDAGPAVAMNSDIGETIGWPEMVHQVAVVFARAPKPAVLFTSNYGEAGALDHYGADLGLPAAYSGHNGFAEWGPPPAGQRSIVVVGLHWQTLATYFRGCRPATQISNSEGIDNEENGKLVALCSATQAPWPALWPHLTHLS
jgi:hypothetical protein